MSESTEHSDLVSILQGYMAESFCGGNRTRVFVDSLAINSVERPPPIAGYIPDAYVQLDDGAAVAIGEAKSLRDFENTHTDVQTIAFLKRCAMATDSVFVMAVPWPIERLAISTINKHQTDLGLTDLKCVVLSDANPTGPRISTKALRSCNV